jgi:hypothetical protein
MKTFPKRVCDRINEHVLGGKFAVMSTLRFNMPKDKPEDGWKEATPQYNYDKFRSFKRLLIANGMSFTVASNLSETVDPYAVAIFGVGEDEAMALAKETEIKSFLLGAPRGSFGEVMTNRKSLGAIIVKGTLEQVQAGGSLAETEQNPTHYFEIDTHGLGWIGAWRSALAKDGEGFIRMVSNDVSLRKTRVEHLKSLIKL